MAVSHSCCRFVIWTSMMWISRPPNLSGAFLDWNLVTVEAFLVQWTRCHVKKNKMIWALCVILLKADHRQRSKSICLSILTYSGVVKLECETHGMEKCVTWFKSSKEDFSYYKGSGHWVHIFMAALNFCMKFNSAFLCHSLWWKKC